MGVIVITALVVLAGLGSSAGGARSGSCTTGQSPAIPMVRANAERDLDCPGDDIRIEEELTGYYKAIGCGRKQRYRAACEGLSCTVEPEDGKAIPWRDRPDPSDPISPR